MIANELLSAVFLPRTNRHPPLDGIDLDVDWPRERRSFLHEVVGQQTETMESITKRGLREKQMRTVTEVARLLVHEQSESNRSGVSISRVVARY